MDNLTMWTLIVGFILPNVIAVVQRPSFSKRVRTVVTALFCAAGGAGTAYFNGEFNAKDIVTSMLIVGVATITFYQGFWKPSGVSPAIEDKTSGSHQGERGYVAVSSAVVVLLIVLVLWILLS